MIISSVFSSWKFLITRANFIIIIYKTMKKPSMPKSKIATNTTPKIPNQEQSKAPLPNNNLFAFNPVKKEIVAKP